jgi:hypothetical protein
MIKRALMIMLAVAALAAPVMTAAPAHAESVPEFTTRVQQAYHAKNVKAALWDLFYTAGLDRASYFILLDTIDKLMLLQYPVIVVAEPLHKDEETTERRDGYIYFQNMEPVGAINLANTDKRKGDFVIRQYFGRKDGIYYLTATIRQDLPPVVDVPKDSWFYRHDRGQGKPAPAIGNP